MSSSRLRAGFLSEMQRYPADAWIAGVCAGIADYFGWKAKLVRLVAILLLIFTGFWPAVMVYCVLWYIMDEGDLHSPTRPHYDSPPPPTWPSSPASGASPPGDGSSAPPSRNMGDLKARFAQLEERLRGMEECVTTRDFELRRELNRLER
jgi:phage shock protein C